MYLLSLSVDFDSVAVGDVFKAGFYEFLVLFQGGGNPDCELFVSKLSVYGRTKYAKICSRRRQKGGLYIGRDPSGVILPYFLAGVLLGYLINKYLIFLTCDDRPIFRSKYARYVEEEEGVTPFVREEKMLYKGTYRSAHKH